MAANKKRILVLGALYLGVAGFLVLTNPASLPLPMLVVPFLLLFAALYFTVELLLSRYLPNLGSRAQHALSLSLTSLPILLLILQSIGQLSARDLLITAGLVGGLVFYFRKTDFLK